MARFGFRVAKRAIDIGVGCTALCFAAPVLGATAIAVWKGLGRPIFFVQERPGKDGKLFKMIKFRTMRDAVDSSGRLLPDSERLTRLGAFLRSSSVDELPELFNVVIGDMSLVGPRPLLVEYLPLYSPIQARRHEVRPGITGWAQVNGRNALTWEEKFEHDVWYVDHCSLGLDMKILLKTILSVVRRSGISADGEATMPRFTGTADSAGL
jgi:lipopolysaccharide/colanic/teichoic acid biosynthesis glycosyltransferase